MKGQDELVFSLPFRVTTWRNLLLLVFDAHPTLVFRRAVLRRQEDEDN